ncbi:MAG: hypothetical protein MRECE_5c004 [Mycoplasmataceae bacterium CE_OT135]|nr:MAG: hypothetical protein MRECE_5c004 [Mycoplasmataceae bacterium CE_OT135]
MEYRVKYLGRYKKKNSREILLSKQLHEKEPKKNKQ